MAGSRQPRKIICHTVRAWISRSNPRMPWISHVRLDSGRTSKCRTSIYIEAAARDFNRLHLTNLLAGRATTPGSLVGPGSTEQGQLPI